MNCCPSCGWVAPKLRSYRRLTDQEAVAIIKDNRVHREICVEYNISQPLVSLIKSGMRYKRAWRMARGVHNSVDRSPERFVKSANAGA